jgi:hypothetical protein
MASVLDGPPQLMTCAMAGQNHLIHGPRVAGSRVPLAPRLGVCWPERPAP